MTTEHVERYLQSCSNEFWKRIFRSEVDCLLKCLAGTRDVLSIGCGPAIIEKDLSEHGFNIMALDVSREALVRAPDGVWTVLAPAEDMPFPDSTFDAVVYVASLQFIKDYKAAVAETVRVLRPDGRLIVMLLNPESHFFREKFQRSDSYVSRIRHTSLREIEDVIGRSVAIYTEYFLGVKDETLIESTDPKDAALYIIFGTKKLPT